MFVVTLTYVADISEVDAELDGHMAWLESQFTDGVFVASGPRVPRHGGVILAQGVDREELNRRLSLDPYAEKCLADYTVIEFDPTRVAEGYEKVRSDSASVMSGLAHVPTQPASPAVEKPADTEA
ncbi:YciI family protein [Cryptosporangium sp. NPDC051539]|uniref:YciI family protein n=1 Tax=Cryptosporangium sp. NPDC051539 TaxID=3363962 RepID=UPI00378F98A5